MKVLVIGGGGREHALCWKIAQSELVDQVYCAPGNAGTAEEKLVKNVDISATDQGVICQFIDKENIDLTVVGPEQPLVEGLADMLQSKSKLVFGPIAKAAQLEGSKAFAKAVMCAAEVSTAGYETFDDFEQLKDYLKNVDCPLVIKVDGLAAGKGVTICKSHQEAFQVATGIFQSKQFGAAGGKVLVEEFIEGDEISVIGFCSGTNVELLQTARDHKTLDDFGKGPNTGGMGAYTPVKVKDDFLPLVKEQIFLPVLKKLAADGIDYYGVLYAGLMLDRNGKPYVLEFNVRFGDPETQPLLFHMASDIVPYLLAVAEKKPLPETIKWHEGTSLCVVLSSAGYPGSYEKGIEINADQQSANSAIKWFHAGTTLKGNQLMTNGGRVLAITARGENLQEARALAYGNIGQFSFAGVHYRNDIGSND